MVTRDMKETLQWVFGLSLNVAVVLFWLTINFISFESSGKYSDSTTRYYIALLIAGVSHAISMIVTSLLWIYWARKETIPIKKEDKER